MLKPKSLIELSSLSKSTLSHIQTEVRVLRLPDDKSVAVLRYDDVNDALGNPELTVRHRFRATLRLFGPTILDADGPDQRRQRSAVVRGLAQARVELIDTGIIDQIAARAVARLRGRPAVELIEGLAVRIVTEVMAHLTGLSAEESLHLYRLYRSVDSVISGDTSAFEKAKANLVDALDVYAARNLRPATGHSAPLTRALNDAVNRNRLSRSELERHQIFLFMAGVDTTVGAISNVLWMLATDSGLLPRLREMSSGQLSGAAAELLRCQPPIFSVARFPVISLNLCGVAVKHGTPVHLCLATACWDPDKFPDPHRIRLTRPNSTNLMFGYGSHYCPGTAIAKREVEASLYALVHQVANLHLLDDPPPPINGHIFRIPRALNASIEWAE